MAVLFVSHSSADQDATWRVREQLLAKGFAALFVDFDAEHGIPAGRNWERELYAQVRKADAIVFLSSPASVASHWCFAEIALARLLGKPVFPVVVKAGPHHPLLSDTQGIDLVREGDAAFERLWEGLRTAGIDPSASFRWDGMRPPYPGLEPFAEEDAAVFFGRELETKRLLELLQPGLHGRFVAVVGPSGSGKSSLVRAGLLPRLARLPQRWLVVPRLVPGNQPARNLARSLAVAYRDRGEARPPAELTARLAGGAQALVALVEGLRDFSTGEPPSVLLVVDQAEELATLTGAAERSAFLELLHGVVQQAIGISVLATVRAEFLGPLLQQPGAGQFVDEALLVSPLDRSQLFTVIERPAKLAGLQFAPGLVGRLVEDAQGGDALPLLAFTLRQLAEGAGPEGQITAEAYEASGGVVGTLRAQADRAAAGLANSQCAELVVPTLTELATVVGTGEPTRRRVARDSLTPVEDQVVQAFIDARLLVSRRDEQGRTVVEVAHEALLRQWPPLRQAIEARRAELRVRADLERWAQDWKQAGHRDSDLIDGERLYAAQRWAAAHAQELPRLPGVSEFLARSARQHQHAMQSRSEALASRALAELDRDPQLATLLAVAAVEEYGPSPRATLALSAALTTSYPRLVLRGHKDVVRAVTFAADGGRLATASSDGTARVWDVASGAQLHRLSHRGGVWGVAFAPDGQRLATAGGDGAARVWDVASGAQLSSFGHEGVVWGVAFAPGGGRLATAGDDGTASVWDVASGAEVQTLAHHGSVWGVAFSADGGRLATASSDGTARLWDLASGVAAQTLTHRGAVRGVAFAPNGNRLATASDDGIARVWDLASEVELHTLAHQGGVWSVAFAPDGRSLATASDDGNVRVWDVASEMEVQTLAHQGGVWGVAFSPDGNRLASTGIDGTARVWVLAPEAEVHAFRHQGVVRGVAFGPDGNRLASAGDDGVARVWDVASGTPLHSFGHQGGVWGVVFAPDGDRLASAGDDGFVRVWDVSSEAEARTLAHQGTVWAVAFAPDGNRLASAGDDGIVRVWDLAGEGEPRTFAHQGRVWAVAFAPDGNRLASAGIDGVARVWDVAGGAEVQALRHQDGVRAVAFAPDGGRLATASDDGIARVWDVRSDVLLLARARERVGRQLTADERRMAGLLP